MLVIKLLGHVYNSLCIFFLTFRNLKIASNALPHSDAKSGFLAPFKLTHISSSCSFWGIVARTWGWCEEGRSAKTLEATGRMIRRKGWRECQTGSWRSSACFTSAGDRCEICLTMCRVAEILESESCDMMSSEPVKRNWQIKFIMWREGFSSYQEFGLNFR